MEPSPQEQNTRNPRSIGSYEFGKTLGKGTFGKVKSAIHKPTGERVAIKILEKERIVDVADVERVTREIHILKFIRHPNIIQLYEIIQTPKYLFLVMEYVEKGELFGYIVDMKRIKEPEACKFYHQLINGIEYIHRLKIVHRDLKPENLLLDYNMNLKLVDFGLSNTYQGQQSLKTPCGSPCYAAPEMIRGQKYNGLRVDIWSSGVILFAMLCGCLPFEDEHTPNLYKKILSGKFNFCKGLSLQAQDLVSKILNVDQEARFTIDQIRKHPWMRNSDVPNNDGIIVGYNRIPIEKKVVERLSAAGFDPEYMRTCLEANRHNSTTTAYYLMFKKMLRDGETSSCDMASKLFDKSLIEPIKRAQKSKSQLIIEDLFVNPDDKVKFNKRSTPMHQSQTNNSTMIDRSSHYIKPSKSHTEKSNSKRHFDESAEKSHRASQHKNLTIVPNKTIERGRSKSFVTPSNRINKRYREEFDKSLVSRSRDKRNSHQKSVRKGYERSRGGSNYSINADSAQYQAGKLVFSNSMTRDKNRSELAEISNLMEEANYCQTAKAHKRGRSNQVTIGKNIQIQDSFDFSKHTDGFHRRSKFQS